MNPNVPQRSRAGSVRVAVMAIVASIALGTLLAGPASAAENKNDLLQLSRDGVTFATDAIPTMFGSTKGYVPGESRRGIVWVRNASNHTAHLTLVVRNAGTAATSVLPGHLRLQARTSGHRAAAAALPSAGACTPIIDGWTLAAGEALPLTLDLGMAPDAPDTTRKQSAEFTMTFVLQEQGAGKLVGTCFKLPGTTATGAGRASIVIGDAPSWVDDSPTSPGPNHVQSVNEALPEALPLLPQLQSNVEATIYNPWPWIVVISACAYVFTSVRKRSRTR